MSRLRILFADNNPLFLKIRSELLERAGYAILRASSVEEAKRILRDELVDIAVFDIRLEDDLDSNDTSGLDLAKDPAYRSVPKIILTAHPTYEHVREALGPVLDSLPPAVDFLAKKEEPEAMIRAIEKAYSESARVNQNLSIEFNDRKPITFLHISNLIDPEYDGKRLLARAEELETLFRRLYFKDEQIIIDRLLWQRPGCTALAVFKFTKEHPPRSTVVVCGQKAALNEEASRYKMFAPPPGQTSTILDKSSETINLAANVYVLAGADLENTYSLLEAYRTEPDRVFNSVLRKVIEKTLAEWHQGKSIVDESKSLDEVYRRLLGLSSELTGKNGFEASVRALIKQALRVGLKIDYGSGKLNMRFDGHSVSYPDPAILLNQTFDIGDPAVLISSPGTLSGDNILVDKSGQAWLTDFINSGSAPILWNYVSLEAAIRFDWVETSNLYWIYEMEQHLVSGDFNNLDIDDVEPPLRKPLKAIKVIRSLAARTVGKDYLPYHAGILYQAASRIVQAKLSTRTRLLEVELVYQAHMLMAATMISGEILESLQEVGINSEPKEKGIRIDKANQAVWVEGKQVRLRGNSYSLLCNLYDHPNQLRSRRELIEEVFGIKYDEWDRSQISRLNTAINRLRRIIRDDADNPRFLFTHPGGGYRLTPNPEG